MSCFISYPLLRRLTKFEQNVQGNPKHRTIDLYNKLHEAFRERNNRILSHTTIISGDCGMVSKNKKSYCKFLRGRKYVCPYEPEELTVMFCVACRTTKLTNQQDLLIKQNKVIITLLNQIRDLLQEKRTP